MYVTDCDRVVASVKDARHVMQSGDFTRDELDETEKHTLGLVLDIRTRRQCLRDLGAESGQHEQ